MCILQVLQSLSETRSFEHAASEKLGLRTASAARRRYWARSLRH